MSLPSTETPDHLKRLAEDGEWHGCLTLENLDLVADRLRRLLGGQRFTWVSCNAVMNNYRPKVRTGQRITEGIKASRSVRDDDRQVGYITISYSEYVAFLDTTVSDRAEEIGLVSYDVRRKRGAYLSFTGNQVRIEQAENIGPIYWVAAVEQFD
jgi:hypothetical protein